MTLTKPSCWAIVLSCWVERRDAYAWSWTCRSLAHARPRSCAFILPIHRYVAGSGKLSRRAIRRPRPACTVRYIWRNAIEHANSAVSPCRSHPAPAYGAPACQCPVEPPPGLGATRGVAAHHLGAVGMVCVADQSDSVYVPDRDWARRAGHACRWLAPQGPGAEPL